MNEKQLNKWEATRAKGKMRFIIVNGVINWGILTAILWSYVMAITSGKTFSSYFGVAIVAFPIGGIFFGIFTWKLSEKKYLKAKGPDANTRFDESA